MSYPKYENKHRQEQLITAEDFIEWKKYSAIKAPSKYVIVYYPYVLQHLKKKFPLKRIPVNRLMTIYAYKDVGVIRMTGIGSPNAATCLEEIIAMGGKTFLNIGSAGGLHDFGVYVAKKALRDEGTSYHYIAHGDYTYPDNGLTENFMKFLDGAGINHQQGATWTIDAPYKETRAEIQRYKKLGIDTVEMEASALFAVAKVRNVKLAAAFVISDVIGKDVWDPQFDKKHVRQKLKALSEQGMYFLLKYK
jgi:uridine phosphorylase